MLEKAEIEKQINTLNIKPHTPECIVKGHLPQGNLLPVICWPIVSVKITMKIPIINPKTAAPLVMALYLIGNKEVALYDGSWTEWATRSDQPIII